MESAEEALGLGTEVVGVEPYNPKPRRPKPTTLALITEQPMEPAIQPPTPLEPPAPAPPPAPVYREPRVEEVMLAALAAHGLALSARALLLLALVGAFVLALLAVTKPGWQSLAALFLYGLITMPAVVWLEMQRKE